MSRPEKTHVVETSNRQAIEVLKALNHFDYPDDVSQLQDWLHQTKPLQLFLKSCCCRDTTGRLTIDCVNVVFDLMATHGEAVSPAIWDILQVVEDDDVKFLIDSFLKDSKPRLKNTLTALLSAVCRCGQRIPSLQLWCFTYIQALEDSRKYSVLLSVPESLVIRLLQGIVFPYARKLVYSVFERLLYPMTCPHVFNMITDQMPDVVPLLPKDEIRDKFCALVRTLMERFPGGAHRQGSYDRIRAALAGHPDTPYMPSYSLWTIKPKPTAKLSTILECPVCYERLVTPVAVCENGHCICSKCRKQLKTCPTCRALFSNIRMTIIDQIMDMTEFHCKNSDAGCKVRLPYKDIWEHELDCEYRTVSCDIMAYHKPHELVCNEDVVVVHFHEHIEMCHQASVARFDLNTEWRGELRRHKANEVRLLKNSSGTLNFIERIYVTNEEIFFSYHYVGKSEDASNYIYTIKIGGSGVLRKISYSNFCLPNYMGVFDTEADERCLILEPDKIFDANQTKFDYAVRIDDVGVYRMRLKKNKFMLSD